MEKIPEPSDDGAVQQQTTSVEKLTPSDDPFVVPSEYVEEQRNLRSAWREKEAKEISELQAAAKAQEKRVSNIGLGLLSAAWLVTIVGLLAYTWILIQRTTSKQYPNHDEL